MSLPPRFSEAMQKVERDYFDPGYMNQRTNALKALIAGQPPGVTIEQWSPMSVARMSTIEGVADAAVDAKLKRPPVDYYKMLYADTALGEVVPTRCGHAFFGTSQCVFATDAPFDSEQGRGLMRNTAAAERTNLRMEVS